jgi:DNA-binding CsgD family transcriptional regulator
MLFTDIGFQLVGHLERQRDIPSLLASFQRLVLSFGLDGFCIGDAANPKVRRSGRRWGATWPVRWYWRYVSQNHLPNDPVIARINRVTTPFRWSQTYAGASAKGRRVLEEAAEFGFRDGLAVPIHGADGAIAGVNIGGGHYALSRRDELALTLAACYLHARIAGIRAEARQQKVPDLAPRERECLKWVAAGKTDWEISQILAISEQTAHSYVQSALAKLGARTRAQAVALALRSSQIPA